MAIKLSGDDYDKLSRVLSDSDQWGEISQREIMLRSALRGAVRVDMVIGGLNQITGSRLDSAEEVKQKF